MKVKALVSFAGIVTMSQGEEKVLNDKEVAKDLLQAGYVQEVKSPKSKKVKADESK
ncbi:hypothetical protein QUF79_14610 [Fictibacillus enclensis]|uniref:hypothetical protein n=1 Tax=Fictibacillus enclensis TaxID=1017270 RepID=UPI0025A15F9A|nr:hypothetical protein [Fictibacillus enclensis]MDM5199250.1 hypothetical protein [Fictibacillus enclensis]